MDLLIRLGNTSTYNAITDLHVKSSPSAFTSSFLVTDPNNADSEVHPKSHAWVLGALSPGVNLQGHETKKSPTSSAKIKNGGAIPPLPHMSSRHGA
jgi:hypothetical protein